MPELPDLVRVERVLSASIVGRRVVGARAGDPTVLRIMISEAFPADLVGRTLIAVERRGHFMRFSFEGDRILIINAMLVGRYKLLPPAEAASVKDPVALGLALVFEDLTELRYIDDKRMGKIYVTRMADEAAIPVYGQLGVDVVSAAFDLDAFRAIVRRRRDQVRMLLMDKKALASIGNAYADEILFEAHIHPKTFVRQLGPEDVERLYLSIGRVLRHAIEEVERRGEPVDVKVRDFLAVRGRDGKPCPRCGTTIRAVRVGDGDACFCPTCQPTTRRLFVDWSRLPPAGEKPGKDGGQRELVSGRSATATTTVTTTLPAPGPTSAVKTSPSRPRAARHAADEKGPPRRRPRHSTNQPPEPSES